MKYLIKKVTFEIFLLIMYQVHLQYGLLLYKSFC